MPSGLAYKVYRRRVPSSAKLSTGTNDPPERPSPASPPERSESSALGITSAKTVTRRVRTEEHDNSQSCGRTHHPGRHDASAAANRRAGSRLPESLAERRGRNAGLDEPPPRPTAGRTGDPDASTEIAPSRGLHEPLTDGSPTLMLPSLCALHLRDRRSTKPDRPEPRSFGDNQSRSLSYRLDTPAPPTVARLWCRLVSGSEELSPWFHSPESPADVGSGWNPAATLPPRPIPTDPARQETPGTIGTRSMPIGSAPQHMSLRTMHPEDPEGPPWRPQPLTKYR
jgi:hypothetical protein